MCNPVEYSCQHLHCLKNYSWRSKSPESAATSGCWQCTNKREIKRAGLYIRDCHDAVLLYVPLLSNRLLATAFIWAGKSFPNIRNRIHLLFGDVTNSLVLYCAEKRSQMASALDFLKVQNPQGVFFFVWCKVHKKKGNICYYFFMFCWLCILVYLS